MYTQVTGRGRSSRHFRGKLVHTHKLLGVGEALVTLGGNFVYTQERGCYDEKLRDELGWRFKARMQPVPCWERTFRMVRDSREMAVISCRAPSFSLLNKSTADILLIYSYWRRYFLL